MSKIILAAAVPKELAPFLDKTGILPNAWHAVGNHQLWVSFTGVGPVASAFHIQKLIYELKPDLIIQAGIAGYYEKSGLEIGQTVIVVRERLADLGSVIRGDFTDIFPEDGALENPHRFPPLGYPEVSGFTVSTGCSPLADQFRRVYPEDRASVETMEGYALFYVCRQTGTPFLELRTVSNRVSPEREGWDIPLAVRNLSEALAGVLKKL